MRYRHIQNKQGNPVATLASQPYDEGLVIFALSRCNLNCDVFHKRHGRTFAERRIEKSLKFEADEHAIAAFEAGKKQVDHRPYFADWGYEEEEVVALQHLFFGGTLVIAKDAIPEFLKAVTTLVQEPQDRFAVLNLP